MALAGMYDRVIDDCAVFGGCHCRQPQKGKGHSHEKKKREKIERFRCEISVCVRRSSDLVRLPIRPHLTTVESQNLKI